MSTPQRRERRGAGELEAAVLGALWAADGPLTPTEIQTRVGEGLAYNTIHTIITRLADKGLLRRVPMGARTGYLPAKDAAQAAADRMRDALESSRERDAILARFVTALSADDEAALRAALDARPPG